MKRGEWNDWRNHKSITNNGLGFYIPELLPDPIDSSYRSLQLSPVLIMVRQTNYSDNRPRLSYPASIPYLTSPCAQQYIHNIDRLLDSAWQAHDIDSLRRIHNTQYRSKSV